MQHNEQFHSQSTSHDVHHNLKRNPSPYTNHGVKRRKNQTAPLKSQTTSLIKKPPASPNRRSHRARQYATAERSLRTIAPARTQNPSGSFLHGAERHVMPPRNNGPLNSNDRIAAPLPQLSKIKSWEEAQQSLVPNKEVYKDLICSFAGENVAYVTQSDSPSAETLVTLGSRLASLKERTLGSEILKTASDHFNSLLLASYCVFIKSRGVEKEAVSNIWARANGDVGGPPLKGAREVNVCIDKIAGIEGWDVFRATELFIICRSLVMLQNLHQLIEVKIHFQRLTCLP
jgi:hypothetical protein